MRDAEHHERKNTMGHSLSATVFYGIDLGDDETRTEEQHDALPQWWRDDEDWEDVLPARLGWENSVPISDPQAWRAHHNIRKQLIADLGVTIAFHGYQFEGSSIRVVESIESCDYSATRLKGIVDPCTRIDIWNTRLETFCQLLGFLYLPDQVGWHLCASWG